VQAPARATALAAIAVAAAPLSVSGAELRPSTEQAYIEYVSALTRHFEGCASSGEPLWDSAPGRHEALAGGRVIVNAAVEDGILEVPGGLIHHWRGAIFIPGVTLEEVLEVGRAYDDYDRIYTPIESARLLGSDGDTSRLLMRVRQSAGPVSAVLDLWSDVIHRASDGRAYTMSRTHLVRDVKNAGTPKERHAAPGEESGYLWRATTFTRLEAGQGGVSIEYETIGLSRRFPQMTRWLFEPIARRVGRASVEQSLQEMRRAVVAKARRAEQGSGIRD
jgi:hypothetical protein